jgi:hypothetical protein
MERINSDEIRDLLSDMKMDVIDCICDTITEAKAVDVKLSEPISYQYIDEQANQSIDRVNAEQRSVEIDCAGFGEDYSVKLVELDLEMLLNILEAIEDEDYEIWEELSEDEV